MNNRYLTKSRFKLAAECPAKLFYTGKKDVYPDKSLEDSFLEALAEGGFQVGELAKAYYPDGHDITTLDYEEALQQTNALLEQENVTIFEAAVRFENLFIRIDVLRKQGNVLDLIEVKAKSFDSEEEFRSKRGGGIAGKWYPYLIDVAFQDYVLRKAFPGSIIRPSLMLADKNSRTSVDGLNRKFRISRNAEGRKSVERIGDVSPEALGDPILTAVDVREYVLELQEETYEVNGSRYSFGEYIGLLSAAYAADEKIPPEIICTVCKKCQFKATAEEEVAGMHSGFRECCKEALDFSDADFDTLGVMDIWDLRNEKQLFFNAGRYFMHQLNETDFDLGKKRQERQWLQVRKTVDNDPAPWVDMDVLREAFSSWTFPLHFIDFETSAVAIPFTADRRPYETVAFQFSHHIVREDWSVEHVDEYINTVPGEFPNFEFVRRLKASLESDDGTVFRYAAHENTVLNHIARQLEVAGDEIADRRMLIDWIHTLTYEKKNKKIIRQGERCMVDLLELVKKCWYQLDMGGSNSIKDVLPAMLNHSDFLQEKYSRPDYNSRNYHNQAWVERDDDDRVRDPYKLLPDIFADISRDELDRFETDGKVADGAAAMTAYARLQFSDIPDTERQAVQQALLRYCELDTLAMVMIVEAWHAVLQPQG